MIEVIDSSLQPRSLDLNLSFTVSDEGGTSTQVLNPDETTSAEANLSEDEKSLLEDCEKVIAAGIQTFHAVGLKLGIIKAGKLYRATHKSFDLYCQEKWGFGRMHASRLIDAAKVVETIKKCNQFGALSVPDTEAAARVLVGETPENIIAIAKETKKKVGDRKAKTKDFSEIKRKRSTPTDPKVEGAPDDGEKDEVHQRSSMPTAAEYCEIPELPPLSKLAELAKQASFICTGSSRLQEILNILDQLKKYLPYYAQWQEWIEAQNRFEEAA